MRDFAAWRTCRIIQGCIVRRKWGSTSVIAHGFTQIERIATDFGGTVAAWIRHSDPISTRCADFDPVITMLTSQPTPEQVLGLRPAPELQARVNDLLERQNECTQAEATELERYLLLEHLVRLAKAYS